MAGDGVGFRGPVAATAVIAALLALAPGASAQLPGEPVVPIPGDQPTTAPQFLGGATVADKIRQRWRPAQNPFMAPDPNNNVHNDTYMTDAYRRLGPLGSGTQTLSTQLDRSCGGITFDRDGRLVTVCLGGPHPVLALFDPDSLETLAAYDLPAQPDGGQGSGLTGGGYYYLDHRDRAVVPTKTRHIFVLRHDGGTGFSRVEDYDLSGVVGSGDGILAALPDFKGRIWFLSPAGVVGWVNPRNGAIRAKRLGERIRNSFALDERGGVFVVTNEALYRFEARKGRVRTRWRRRYGGEQAGSGTTPTLIGKRKVAITNEADPIRVVVYRRGRKSGGKKICSERAFERGASSTEQSLIAAKRALIVENNYGYGRPANVSDGKTTTPGLQRVDVRKGRCRTVWRSDAVSPSAVPKASLRAGLVYTYTKPATSDGTDPWYFTALDFDTGATRFERLAGEGRDFDNQFAPITIGPDGSAYIGVRGGMAMFRD